MKPVTERTITVGPQGCVDTSRTSDVGWGHYNTLMCQRGGGRVSGPLKNGDWNKVTVGP